MRDFILFHYFGAILFDPLFWNSVVASYASYIFWPSSSSYYTHLLCCSFSSAYFVAPFCITSSWHLDTALSHLSTSLFAYLDVYPFCVSLFGAMMGGVYYRTVIWAFILCYSTAHFLQLLLEPFIVATFT